MALILSGTDGLSDVDGSAATPAIRGTDTNTGIFFPAADTIAFSEGGVESMRIDSSGNLGIGTSSPAAKLDVRGIVRVNEDNAGTKVIQLRSDWAGVDPAIQVVTNNPLLFVTNGSERARITSGGDLLVGTTTLDGGFTCNKTASFAGNIYPAVDNNGWNCGTSSKRWSTIFAVTGTINTSDARLKTEVRSLQDAEISAAQQLAYEIGSYKWLSAIEQKGPAARHHIGMTVQRAIEIMETNGLSPFAYGFICFDQWDEVISEDGVKVQEAGNSYSFRIDELGLFIARGQQAAIQEQQAIIQSLTARIEALEGKA